MAITIIGVAGMIVSAVAGYAVAIVLADEQGGKAEQYRRAAVAWQRTARKTSQALEEACRGKQEAESRLARMAHSLRGAHEREGEHQSVITGLRATLFATEREWFKAQEALRAQAPKATALRRKPRLAETK